MVHLARSYGPFVRTRLPMHIYFVSGPALIEEILVKQASHFQKDRDHPGALARHRRGPGRQRRRAVAAAAPADATRVSPGRAALLRRRHDGAGARGDRRLAIGRDAQPARGHDGVDAEHRGQAAVRRQPRRRRARHRDDDLGADGGLQRRARFARADAVRPPANAAGVAHPPPRPRAGSHHLQDHRRPPRPPPIPGTTCSGCSFGPGTRTAAA